MTRKSNHPLIQNNHFKPGRVKRHSRWCVYCLRARGVDPDLADFECDDITHVSPNYKTMFRHLQGCAHTDENTRSWARNELARTVDQENTQRLNAITNHGSASGMSGILYAPSIPAPLNPLASSSSSSISLSAFPGPYGPSAPASTFEAQPSAATTDFRTAPTPLSSNSLALVEQIKQARLPSDSDAFTRSLQNRLPPADVVQEHIDTLILRITAANALPFSWVSNFWTILLFNLLFALLSLAKYHILKLPSRKSLAGRILDRETKWEWAEQKKELRAYGCWEVGLITDAWAHQRRNLVGFASIFDKAGFNSVHFRNVYDVTGGAKDGETWKNKFQGEVEITQGPGYGATVRYGVADDGGDARGGRNKMLRDAFWNQILLFLCYAHQSALAYKDVIKVKSDFTNVLAEVVDLVTWIVNHSRVLHRLQNLQMSLFNWQHPKTFILPTLVRWTTHYLCLDRLLESKRVLLEASRNHMADMKAFGGSRADQKNKTDVLMGLARSEDWWKKVSILHRVSRYFAIAMVILQGNQCGLDDVLLVWGWLVDQFTKAKDINGSGGLPHDLCQAAIDSLEKRWAASDKIPFIVAVTLNPHRRRQVFNLYHNELSIDRLIDYALVLAHRIYKADVEWDNDAFAKLRSSLRDWYIGKDVFPELLSKNIYDPPINTTCTPDDFWALPSEQHKHLKSFARLLLKICPNSCSVERLFSTMDWMKDKRRNQLSPDHHGALTRVSMRCKQDASTAQPTRTRNQSHHYFRKEQLPSLLPSTSSSGPETELQVTTDSEEGNETETSESANGWVSSGEEVSELFKDSEVESENFHSTMSSSLKTAYNHHKDCEFPLSLATLFCDIGEVRGVFEEGKEGLDEETRDFEERMNMDLEQGVFTEE